MDANWASQNLEVIRTLMERSALYRRALAPLMTAGGLFGTIAAALAIWKGVEQVALYWMVVAMITGLVALLLVRRQAIRNNEPFWSSPMRRVARALSPAFTLGFFIGVLFLYRSSTQSGAGVLLVLTWIALYGCGIHSAGAYMPRGIRLLGWIFVTVAVLLAFAVFRTAPAEWSFRPDLPHWMMGGVFGVLQLGYGIYLFFTESVKRAP
jgi:hypothetical protein